MSENLLFELKLSLDLQRFTSIIEIIQQPPSIGTRTSPATHPACHSLSNCCPSHPRSTTYLVFEPNPNEIRSFLTVVQNFVSVRNPRSLGIKFQRFLTHTRKTRCIRQSTLSIISQPKVLIALILSPTSSRLRQPPARIRSPRYRPLTLPPRFSRAR